MPDNKEFAKSIEQATLKIVREMASKVDKACLAIEADAKTNCPVDQGVLRASMFSQTNVSSTGITGVVANSSEIAPYVHQGTGIYAIDGNGRKTPWVYEVKAGKYKGFRITSGQKPQPFLQDARDSNRDKISRILGGG